MEHYKAFFDSSEARIKRLKDESIDYIGDTSTFKFEHFPYLGIDAPKKTRKPRKLKLTPDGKIIPDMNSSDELPF
jgi:hypothetical protein